ncbi:MAG TPA: hypothetical protein VIM64_06785, partial [Puia sp.]
MSFNIRLLFFPAIVVINACNNHSATQNKSQIEPVKISPISRSLSGQPYPTFNELLDSIRLSPLPYTVLDLDATDSFSFAGFHFIFTTTLAKKESEGDCDSPYTYHFTINDRIPLERT